jgi:streptogramin lyase
MKRVSASFALATALLIVTPACGQQAQQTSQSRPQQPQQSRPPVRSDLGANVRVFEVPPGSHPHDVAPAPDGKVWYTGQRRGTLGILDPDSGQIREVQLGPGLGAARRHPGGRTAPPGSPTAG